MQERERKQQVKAKRFSDAAAVNRNKATNRAAKVAEQKLVAAQERRLEDEKKAKKAANIENAIKEKEVGYTGKISTAFAELLHNPSFYLRCNNIAGIAVRVLNARNARHAVKFIGAGVMCALQPVAVDLRLNAVQHSVHLGHGNNC